MDGMTQSAVDTLLGQLTNLLISEVQLLGGVRDDVQFIKDEMESMNGFLLDVAGGGEPSNQLKAWRKQVREVAYDSQRCMDRYMQTVGASRPSAGLLGSIGQAPQLLRTRRIAKQIKDLKSRARDVGERRQRYGVMAPMSVAAAAGQATATRGSGARAWSLSPLQQQAEEARRRRAIADAADWLDADARQVMDWLLAGTRGAGAHHHRHYFQKCSDAITGFARNMWNSPSKIDQVGPELVKTLMALLGHDDPENIEDAATLLWDYNIEIWKGERRTVVRLIDVLKHKIGLHRAHPVTAKAEASAASPSDGHHGEKNKAAAATVDSDPLEVLRTSSDPEEMLRAEMQYSKQLARCLWRVLFPDLVKQLLLPDIVKQLLPHKKGSRFPRLLSIVTPPVDGHIIEDDALPADKRATELAWRVYQESLQGCYFNCVIWINAKDLSKPRERLEIILQEARKQLPLPSTHDDGRQMGTLKEEKLHQEIQNHLKGKKFLIILADHEDDAPWSDIIPALPSDFSDESAILVTPMIQQTAQFHVWYILSLLFTYLHKTTDYKVHFYSHLAAAHQKANELANVGSGHLADLQGTVKEILRKCRWDTFSTKMFLHALYANPHRSKDMLEKLLLGLNEFNTVSNAREMIRLCYDDLHSHYKTCFLYLSIFPPGFEIRRTRLVRRWAAEGLVTRRGRQTATDEAEQCFSELLDRGLLLPAGSTGPPTTNIKMCKLDSHVFSFITRTPREDDSADITELLPAFAHRLSIPRGIKLSKKMRQATGWKKKKECTAAAGLQDSIDDMVSFLNLFPTTQLGWIKVLDLEGYCGLRKQHLKNICNKIFQLKYLSLRNTGVTELPKEIEKLQLLETFDIRQTKIKSFPTKSTVLPRLERLLANHSRNDDNGSCEESFSTIFIPRGIGRMTNIQILSHVQVSNDANQEALNDVVQLQQLRKLGIVIIGKVDMTHLIQVIGMLNESLYSLSVHITETDGMDVDLTNRSATFSAPRSLTSLKISGKIGGLPNWICDLQMLSKITLCRTLLTGSDVKILGDLVNLCFISLWHVLYSNYLVFQKGFKRLEVLTIQDSEISGIIFQWKACPKLEKIVWTSTSTTCKLETLEVHKLPCLKEIEIKGLFDLTSIKKSVEANRNNPKLKYKQTNDNAAPAATSSMD